MLDETCECDGEIKLENLDWRFNSNDSPGIGHTWF